MKCVQLTVPSPSYCPGAAHRNRTRLTWRGQTLRLSLRNTRPSQPVDGHPQQLLVKTQHLLFEPAPSRGWCPIENATTLCLSSTQSRPHEMEQSPPFFVLFSFEECSRRRVPHLAGAVEGARGELAPVDREAGRVRIGRVRLNWAP